MAKNKTTATSNSVDAYLDGIANEARKNDCKTLDFLFREATGTTPKMWGTAIVGYGSYHYVYDSGHEGDAPLAGFSSRSNAITLYLLTGFEGQDALLEKLGKHTTGKGCLYIKSLKDVDETVLERIIRKSFQYMKNKYPDTAK